MSTAGSNRVYKADRFSKQWEETLAMIDTLNSGDLHATSSEYRLLHAKCLDALSQLLQQVEYLRVYSDADSIDDLSSKQLKYLNLNFYIAAVLERTTIDTSKTAVDARISIAHMAIRKYIEFHYLLKSLKLLNDSDANRLDFLDSVGVEAPLDLSAVAFKIVDCKIKLNSTARLSKSKMFFEKCRAYVDSFNKDNEEEVRTAEIARLNYHFDLAWKSISNLMEEVSLLSGMAKRFKNEPLKERPVPFIPSAYIGDFVRNTMSQEGTTFQEINDKRMKPQNQNINNQYSSRVESFNPRADNKLVNNAGKILRPFTILPDSASKDRLRNSVYGTGQRLPTITIEELVEKELANQAKPGLTKEEIKELQNEDDEDYVDALTMKARKWDDFVEKTPKGSGNTMNLG